MGEENDDDGGVVVWWGLYTEEKSWCLLSSHHRDTERPLHLLAHTIIIIIICQIEDRHILGIKRKAF